MRRIWKSTYRYLAARGSTQAPVTDEIESINVVAENIDEALKKTTDYLGQHCGSGSTFIIKVELLAEAS